MEQNHDCIFCKIINGTIQSAFVAENDWCIVINDIHPKAPVHYLVIPKKHIENLQHMTESDVPLVGQMMRTAQQIMASQSAFRLIMNNGAYAGQSVFHMHCHLLAGKQMSDF